MLFKTDYTKKVEVVVQVLSEQKTDCVDTNFPPKRSPLPPGTLVGSVPGPPLSDHTGGV